MTALFIEVGAKDPETDAIGNAVLRDIAEDLRIKPESVSYADVYEFRGGVSGVDAEKVAKLLLADPISQKYSIGKPLHSDSDWEITVKFNEDVTDNVGHTTADAVNDLMGGCLGRDSVRTARRYFLRGELSEKEVKRVCTELLANEQIETFSYRKGK